MNITRGNAESGAIFSPCEKYRYALWRDLYPLGCAGFDPPIFGDCVFVGLNPSTATERKLDPTCRRCIDFTRRWNCRRYIMLNAFAFRATKPKVMKAQHDPVGPDNDEYLLSFTRNARIVVAAWGSNCDELRAKAVCQVVGRTLECLGINQDGTPTHPLFVKGDTVRVPYSLGGSKS